MSKTFLVSDTHFGHAGVCSFLRNDGTKLRPWTNPDEMDEALVENWNKTVSKNDKVYHLGDVVINRKALNILYRLNGEKVLIKGNHDIFKLSDYSPFFKDIRAYHILDKILLSHIPLHPESLTRWKGNVHGHLHSNNVMIKNNKDPRYYCVCVEQTDYTPVDFEVVRKYFNNLGPR